MKLLNCKCSLLFAFAFLFILFETCMSCYAANLQSRNRIIVNAERVIGPVNKNIFGHNLLAYNRCKITPCENNIKMLKSSITGFGIWNPRTKQPEQGLLNLLEAIKPTSLRFPGGGAANYYDWKETIGPPGKRPKYLFGLDEFMRLCERLKAEPIITLNYFTASDKDLVDLVEYLVAANDGANLNGGEDWAARRASNGHSEPYKVKWFELGNEVYNGDKYFKTPIHPLEYSSRYRRLSNAFKAINTSVYLGAVLEGGNSGLSDWDYLIAKNIGTALDFGVIHFYPLKYRSDNSLLSEEEIFSIALSSPMQIGYILKQVSVQLKKIVEKKVPLAITEFNAGYFQEYPVPYRFTLGNALLIADLLRIFLSSDEPVISANFWHFANSAWGMVNNPLFHEGKGNYEKTPLYFLYDLFRKHLGSRIVESTVMGPSYCSRSYINVAAAGSYRPVDTPVPGSSYSPREISSSSWKKRNGSGVKIKGEKNILKLNFPGNVRTDFSHLSVKIPLSESHRYRLSAKIKTEGLEPRTGLFLLVKDAENYDENRWVSKTMKVEGTSEWTDIFTEFSPPPQCNEVKIVISRNSDGNNTEGIAWVKDVRIEVVGPRKSFPATQYLSVIATSTHDDETYLIVINKNPDKDIDMIVQVNRSRKLSHISGMVLTGKSLTSLRETEYQVIREKILPEPEKDKNKFAYTFRKHSITFFRLK